jgi:hypothetical protein
MPPEIVFLREKKLQECQRQETSTRKARATAREILGKPTIAYFYLFYSLNK